MRRGLLLATAAVVAAGWAVGIASPPAAATSGPAPATGVRVLAVSTSSLVVVARPAAGATGYRLYVSARRSDLYAANLDHARRSVLGGVPRMRVTSLHYALTPVYFRVQTTRGRRHALEPLIHSTYLRPAVPSAFAVHAAGPAYLTWTAGAVTGYRVEQADNAAMTLGHRVYAPNRVANQFTPPGLARGRSYWFRLYAVNHDRRSAVTSVRSVRVTTSQRPLSVMTYNVLEANTAGQTESGTTIPTWSRRRAGVVSLVRSRLPDVLAVQEAAAWIGTVQGFGGTRQVDDLAAALGSTYALARTEIPPTEHGYQRTGDYLLVRSSTWTATDAAGHWDIGDGRWAAYAVLRSRTSSARVLVISTHLAAGAGATNDAIRRREATTLIRLATAQAAAAGHVPVVYAGDLNSDVNRNHAYDGPGLAMRAARIADAERVAVRLTNAQYNSANLYLRTPPAVDQSIDYVYAAPGVAVSSREVVLRLVDGRFAGVIPSDHNPVFARLDVPF